MSWFSFLFGSDAALVEARREAERKRAEVLVLAVAVEAEADRALANVKREMAEADAISKSMRSVRPQSAPDAAEKT